MVVTCAAMLIPLVRIVGLSRSASYRIATGLSVFTFRAIVKLVIWGPVIETDG